MIVPSAAPGAGEFAPLTPTPAVAAAAVAEPLEASGSTRFIISSAAEAAGEARLPGTAEEVARTVENCSKLLLLISL